MASTELRRLIAWISRPTGIRDKLLIQAESGQIVLVAATPTAYLELARFEALTSKSWNEMALTGEVLVVRNDCEAAAIRLPVNE